VKHIWTHLTLPSPLILVPSFGRIRGRRGRLVAGTESKIIHSYFGSTWTWGSGARYQLIRIFSVDVDHLISIVNHKWAHLSRWNESWPYGCLHGLVKVTIYGGYRGRCRFLFRNLAVSLRVAWKKTLVSRCLNGILPRYRTDGCWTRAIWYRKSLCTNRDAVRANDVANWERMQNSEYKNIFSKPMYVRQPESKEQFGPRDTIIQNQY